MKQTIRFFIIDIDPDTQEIDQIEVDENTFLQSEGQIEYERHTTFLNGVNQICLTKSNGY